MKVASPFLGLLLAALAVPAVAAPWQTMDLMEGEMQLRYAFQADDSQQYQFAVSCVVGSAGYSMFVLTPEPWEETTSYAPDVQLTMSFDGELRPNLQFFFANGSGLVTVAYRQENFEGELGQLLAMLKAASRFEVSYFDKNLSFSGEGSSAAIKTIERACGLL
jgi:hypothetical protein